MRMGTSLLHGWHSAHGAQLSWNLARPSAGRLQEQQPPKNCWSPRRWPMSPLYLLPPLQGWGSESLSLSGLQALSRQLSVHFRNGLINLSPLLATLPSRHQGSPSLCKWPLPGAPSMAVLFNKSPGHTGMVSQSPTCG